MQILCLVTPCGISASVATPAVRQNRTKLAATFSQATAMPAAISLRMRHPFS